MSMVPQSDLDGWLATIDAGTVRTLERRPSDTIVPPPPSGRRLALLDELAARGQAVELRRGKKLGEGGMGVVHEAEQVALGRAVAVKTLKSDDAADPIAAQDLLREAWVTGSLEHPSIVPVHHLEVDAALRPLVILKRVDGVEWHKLIADGPEIQRRFGATDLLAWNLGILGQVLNALRFAHSRGIVHRDLKPANVMIGHFGEVYLLDWGLAVALEDDGTGRFPLAAHATEFAGTPSYMAPEMLGKGGPALSVRTDVYLAGAVLYELITGRPPHHGTTAMAVIASIAASTPEVPADAPAELVQICRRAMAAEPADRYESIAALQLALQGYLEHRGSERIAAGARARLAELIELASGRTNNPQLREHIYRQLAIVRFAFHEALAVWRDNVEATEGLNRATLAVAEYELEAGDPRAAVTLLSELEERPALLARAREAVAAQTAQHRKLEALRDEHDPKLARSARRLAVGGGLAVTVLPLVDAVAQGVDTHGKQLVWSLTWLAVMIGVAVRNGWRQMTAINRRVFMTGVLLFGAQALLELGTMNLGLSLVETRTLMLFLYGVLIAMFAMTSDPWIGVASAGYFAGFAVASFHPALALYVMSATNLVFTLVVMWRWKPDLPTR